MKFKIIFANPLNLSIVAICLLMNPACGWNNPDGAYLGKLTAQSSNVSTNRSGILPEEENDLLVLIKKDGEYLRISIGQSRQLGSCDLRAKINRKNGMGYIDDPQSCSLATSVTGSITVSGNEAILALRNQTDYDNRSFLFRGRKK